MKSVTIKPRFSETDALGHINNAAMVVWFEEARVDYLMELMGSGSPAWAVASLKLDYRGECFFGSPVTVDITVSRLGNSSFDLVCHMHQDNELRIAAQCTMVHIDRETHRPIPLPADVRPVFEAEIQPLPQR